MSKINREQWSSKMGFILAAVGSAVGLGNIWRFPYLLYSNGGGAFLIPYFIAIFTAGIPLLLLEYTLGHKYKGSSPLTFFRMNKKLEWLGWWPSITSFIILTYYMMILSWAFNYVFISFNQGWGEDPNRFFFNDFLKISGGPFDFGHIQWKILFGITLLWLSNWVICYRGVSKGIERINKVLLPLLLTIILIIVIRGISLPGAEVGLNKLFTPDWKKVLEPGVWMDAYGQVFYSLSIAMGVMITFSSYLPKKTDLNNSALMTVFANSGFEFLAAIGVFSILGFMAVNQGVPIEEVASQSIGLAFVVFPKVFSLMGVFGSVFAVLFFTALVFAGITSSVSLTEAFVAAVKDKSNASRKKVVTYVSIIGYLISSLYSTGAGLYLLDIVDAFINAYGLIVIGLLECIVAGWFVTAKVLRNHTNVVSIYPIGRWWDVLIKYVTPTVLTLMLLVNIYKEYKNPYGDYPKLAILVLGWGIIITTIVFSIIASKLKGKYILIETEEGGV